MGLAVLPVSGVHHHKQLYHHRGREGQEEAGSRSQANFMWNGDPANQYAGRSRNYADGAGASTLEGMGYRYASVVVCAEVCIKLFVLCFDHMTSTGLCVLPLRPAVAKAARYHGEVVRRHRRCQAKARRVGVVLRPRYH